MGSKAKAFPLNSEVKKNKQTKTQKSQFPLGKGSGMIVSTEDGTLEIPNPQRLYDRVGKHLSIINKNGRIITHI